MGHTSKSAADEALIARFRAGDEAAFAAFYIRHRAAVAAAARHLLRGTDHDVEAVVQDTFIRAHRALQRDERPIRARAWLVSIARNRALDDVRRRSPPVVALDERIASDRGDPQIEVLHREHLRALVDDMDHLPDQQRAALVLRVFGERSHEEIAAELDTTVSAVKSLLQRARANLARQTDARETDCHVIREALDGAHERRVRPPECVRLHLRGCAVCRAYRSRLRRERLDGWMPLPAWLGGGKLAAAGCCAALAGGAAAGTIVILNPERAPETIAGGEAMIGQPIREGTPLPPGFALVKRRVDLPAGLARKGPMRRVTVTCPEGMRVSGLTLGGKPERDNLRAYQYADNVVLDRSHRAVIEYRAAPSLPPGSSATLGTVCRRPPR